MMRRGMRWGIALTLCVGVVGLSIGLAQNAKPAAKGAPKAGAKTETKLAADVGPEQLLPANAFLYVVSEGGDAHEEGFKKTAAYEALSAGGIYALIDKVLNAAAQNGNPDQTAFARMAYDTVSKKGVSLAAGIAKGEDGPPLPWAVAVLHQGAKLQAAIGSYVKEAAENVKFEQKTVSGRMVTSGIIPDSPGVEVGWWTEGRHLVFVAGINAVNEGVNVATGKSPNISSSPLYKKYRTARDFELTSVSWFDVGQLRKTYGEMPIPAPGLEATVDQIAEVLGLTNVGAIVTRSGYKQRANWSESLVEISGKPSGLMELLAQESFGLGDLPAFPAESGGFSAMSFDLDKAFDTFANVARGAAKLGPEKSSDQVDGLLEQLPQILGFDLKQDLLAPLGNIICLYDDSQHGILGIGLTLAIEVDDAAKLRTTIDDLLERLEDNARGDVMVSRVRKQEREIISINPSERGRKIPFGLSFAITEKWLVAGMMPQSIEAFALRQEKKLPAWQPTGAFAEVVEFAPEKFSGVTISDPRKTYGMIVGYAPWILAALQMTDIDRRRGEDATPFPITAADIPPAELITRPLFPNISFTMVEESGIHTTSRSSLPAIPFMDGGSGVGTAAVGVALLLPAVQQAREAARRSQSSNNLKQMGLALHNYHDANNSLPMAAKENDELKLEERISWIVDLLPYFEQSPLYEQVTKNEAWNSEDNAEAMATNLPVLQNPSANAARSKYGTTHYVGMAGVGKESLTAKKHDKKTGIFGYDRKTRFQDVLDGTSNTIMVTEINPKEAGPWGEAKSSIKALTKKPYINGPDGVGSAHSGGMFVLMADGSVHFVATTVDPQTLEDLSTAQGGEVVGDF